MARSPAWQAAEAERRQHADEFLRHRSPVAPDLRPLTEQDRAEIESGAQHLATTLGIRRRRLVWTRNPTEFRSAMGEPHRWTDPGANRALRRQLVAVVLDLTIRAVVILLICASALVTVLAALRLGHLDVPLPGPFGSNRDPGGAPKPLLLGLVAVGSTATLCWLRRRLRKPWSRWVREQLSDRIAWETTILHPTAILGPDRRVSDLLTAGPDDPWIPAFLELTGVTDGEAGLLILGPAYGPQVKTWQARYRYQLLSGTLPTEVLSPTELEWLLDRQEVEPRELAVALLGAHRALGRAVACVVQSDRVVVLEPPQLLHREPLPGGGTRLHRDDGPAVQWPGGGGSYFLHGTPVPADLVELGWDVGQIHREANSEIRRLAVERMGWDTYIRLAGLRDVATAPDPGNPGAVLRLCDIPRVGRVLLMRNGSPDRSGALRVYGELVPASIDDPVAAAAWQYGCSVNTYRRLQRRT